MRHLFAAAVVLASAGPALAHDFWLQPLYFNLAPGVQTPMTVEVGHGPARTRWSGAVDRVVLMRAIGPNGANDLKSALQPNVDRDGVLSFSTPGTYLVAFESTYAESNLPAIRFNDYIAAEGLTPAVDARRTGGGADHPGREIYSRRAKAVIQVGAQVTGPQPWVTRPIGLTLEIVPEKNPYGLAPGEDLPVRVFYDGKPLAGALVKLTNLEFDLRPVAVKRSDAQGRASFQLPRTGTWLVNTIWTRPLKNDPRADFDTTFSSLTFGFGRMNNGR